MKQTMTAEVAAAVASGDLMYAQELSLAYSARSMELMREELEGEDGVIIIGDTIVDGRALPLPVGSSRYNRWKKKSWKQYRRKRIKEVMCK